jgi:tetratricopeptide (TPR) repeat protein
MALSALTIVREAFVRGSQWSRRQVARIPQQVGRHPLGEDILIKVLALIPDRGKLAAIKARILWTLNDRLGALQTARRALALRPHDPTLIVSLARMEIFTGSYGDAEARLRAALAGHDPGARPKILWHLISLLTYALLHQGRSQEAWTLLSSGAATRLTADRVEFLKAHVCRYTRRYDEAEDGYRAVLARQPYDVLALLELAELLSLRGRFDEAEALHHRLMRITGDPTLNARNHSHTLLAQGRVREGWARNLLRVENRELKRLKGVRVWDGSDLASRSIFVIVEGGTGDELRDAVCYRELSARARQVTIACDPRMETLLRRSFPKVKTWPVGRAERISGINRRLSRLMDDATLEEARRHDFCVVGPDLFYFLKPSMEDYGKPAPYLLPDPVRVAHWRERLAALGPGPKIGLGWSTIRKTYRTFSYYTNLADWGPILTIPGAVFVNLQYGDCADEIVDAEQRFGIKIHQWPELDLLNDFDSVAALIVALDLALAPNTTTLELAGALGARAWYMVNEYQTLDHFRLKDRATGQDRSYPSVRIFMAQQPGDSASLIAQVGEELRRTFGASNAGTGENLATTGSAMETGSPTMTCATQPQ